MSVPPELLSIKIPTPVARERDGRKPSSGVWGGVYSLPLHNLYQSDWMTSPKQRGGRIPPSIVPISVVYAGLRKPCEVFRAEARDKRDEEKKKQAEKRAEDEKKMLSDLAERSREEAKEREEEIARRAAAFRESILAALRAAEESDPFASIRGDFDLTASDSRQWKTILKLPDAEKCGLLRTPLANPASTSAWTFGCHFPVSSDGYEHMVESVRQVLNLAYQPDERATNINQVFFADPSRPDWRLFVGRINQALVGISVVAVNSVGTSPGPTMFSGVPTQLPLSPSRDAAAPSIRGEVEAIEKSGIFLKPPPALAVPSERMAGTGMCECQVTNKTRYRLRVMIAGSVERAFELAANESNLVGIPAGSYKLAVRALDGLVTPLLEVQTYSAGTRYSSELVISPK